MSSIYEKIDNRIETFLSTLKRFPLASFSAFLITLILFILVDYTNQTSASVVMAYKVAFVATLGLVLFPALQLLGRSILFPLLGLILLTLYYYILPTNLQNMSMTLIIRHVLLAIALFFMIFWAPFIFRKSDNDTFWEYAQTIIFGLVTAVFFSIVVYAGLAAAFFAVEKLFHFNLESVRYGQLAIIIFGILGINFFLSQIPKHPLFLQVRPYSNVKRLFSKNILAPIALIYFIILFAYTGKILINMTWPAGILSWIIVAFSFIAIISFLFLSPYLKKSTVTQRLIWLAIFLQTIMLGMALWMRVEEYGITYNRYLLAMFGLWLVLMSLYFMLFGKAQQKWLFFFATLFILVSQFGEYSAKNMTKESQVIRLTKLIETAHPRSEKLDIERKYEISNGLNYLEEYYDLETFENIIPHILKKYKMIKEKQNNEKRYSHKNYVGNFAPFATKELGFKYINKWDWRNYKNNNGLQPEAYYFHAPYNNKAYIKTKNYNWLIDFNMYASKKEHFVPLEKNLSIKFEKQLFVVKEGESTLLSINLKTFIQNIVKDSTGDRELSAEMLTYENDNNSSRIKIIFQNLSVDKDENIQSLDAKILLKIKEP